MSELQKPINYTNRELGLMLGQINESLTCFIKENSKEHKEVMAKQDHTNGDVKKLKIWKAYLTGGFSVLAVVVGFMMYQTDLLKNIVQIAFN